MKPQTRKEKEVDALARELKPVNERYVEKCIIKQAERTAFSYPVKKGYTCGVCGQRFDRHYKRCPHCHGKFNNYQELKGYTEYFCEGQFDNVKGWVVERIVLVKIKHQRGAKQSFEWSEVLQRWYPYDKFTTGQKVDRHVKDAIIRATQKRYGSCDLSLYGDMEIRRLWKNTNPYYSGRGCYDYTPASGYKWTFRIPEELHRRGLRQKHDEPIFMAHLLMKHPHFETLVKRDLRKLYLKFMVNNGIERLEKLWPSLKVALRGGLITAKNYYGSEREYLDYLDMVVDSMSQSKTNLSVVLPDDFQSAFQNARRMAERARKKEEFAKYDKILASSRKPLLKWLNIENTRFCLVVLTSVEQFQREGNALHHCVYANGYYKKENSLILSARMIDAPDRPVETIELRLDDNLRIAQCYGDHNHASQWHQEILQLVESGIPQIRKAMASIV